MADLRIDQPWLTPPKSNHAELPLWDEQSQCLFWVDMMPSPAIVRVQGMDEKTMTRAEFKGQEVAGGVFLRQSSDQLIVGTKLGWGSARFDADKKEIVDYRELVNVKSVTKGERWDAIRLNEATSDARGRIWFATCCEGDSDVPVQLYLFDPSKNSLDVVPIAPAELTMSNSLVIFQDRLYLSCSERGKIWQYRVHLDATEPSKLLGDGRLFLELDKPMIPDGMTADSDGNLYLAVFQGGCVQVYTPEAKLLQTISLPAQAPTCTVFAGPDLDELVITTHAVTDDVRQMLVDSGGADAMEDAKARYPQGEGGVYRVKLDGVRGVVKPRVR